MGILAELVELKDEIVERFGKGKTPEKEDNILGDVSDEVNRFFKRMWAEDSAIGANGFSSGVGLVYLDDRVDDYIKWYCKNFIKDNYDEKDMFRKEQEIRNFIEKMAVWYELRYPNYEINRLMPDSTRECINVNDVMFKDNPYVREMYGEDSDVKYLDWDRFYNACSFVNSLPADEFCIFLKPEFPDIAFIDKNEYFCHFHLTKDGYIEMAEGLDSLSQNDKGNIFLEEDFEGKHIKEAVELLKERGIKIPSNGEVQTAIRNYDKFVYRYEGFLDCVMYRIIERGGNRIGPRRGFLFAKEFDRNIDIPMIYGVDTSDPGLRYFMNEYIKAGGHKDLCCYENYLRRDNNKKTLETVYLEELYKCDNHYSDEEVQLHQRFIDTLVSYIASSKDNCDHVKHVKVCKKEMITSDKPTS